MGFYGHISNIQRTSMTFDKIYPNRFTMDSNVENDGVYAGRYVLVDYDQQINSSLIPAVILFDGVLYAPPVSRELTDGVDELETLVPLTIDNSIDTDMDSTFIKSGVTVAIPTRYNLRAQVYNDETIIVPAAMKQYAQIADQNYVKRTYNLLYNHKTKQFVLDSANSAQDKTCCSFSIITAVEDEYNGEQLDKNNYILNAEVDQNHYRASRSYDSTVWQKTYDNKGNPKYVMIAELNSVVPILDIQTDAPTMSPVMPHFDKESNNIYYKLHMQPQWGFRIKSAEPNIKIPVLDSDGNPRVGLDAGITRARNDESVIYPTDEDVMWVNTSYKDNSYHHQQISLANKDSKLFTWQDESVKGVPGAIYYNKDGFKKEISTHSNRTNPKIKDEIAITPTGYSGHMYPTHPTDGKNIVQPDTHELSIMLPSIGNAVANLWDLIYGINKTNTAPQSKEASQDHERNLNIRWEDAKQLHAKEGLRLVKEGTLGYSYNPDQVNTLAGVINSAQDIMGMIITEHFDIDNIENWNENYIYYDKNSGKYYYKKRAYTYEPVEGDVDLEPVELVNWDDYSKTIWWEDTNSSTPDYICEKTYRPERKYVLGANVPTNLSKIFTSDYYEPNKYYLYSDKNYQEKETKAPFHVYYKSDDAEQDPLKVYWKVVKAEPANLKPDGQYYVPNKFYEGHFTLTTVENAEDLGKKIASGVRLFVCDTTSTIYGLQSFECELLSADDFNKINGKDVYYLTLETCAMTEEEYKKTSGNTRPILFYSKINSDQTVPQNYYVVDRKYELFTDKDVIEASPGVYYQLKIEEGKTEKDYIDADKFLLPAYLSKISIDKDVIYDTDYLYFREKIEMKLSEASNVVDIRDASVVVPEFLPENLYQACTIPLAGGGSVEGYKSISAQSDEIVTAKNFSEVKDLCILTVEELSIGYQKDTYYYQVSEGDLKNSIIIDSSIKPTTGRIYYTRNMINKQSFIAGPSQERLEGITYYTKPLDVNDYVEYTNELIEGEVYYISSLTTEGIPEFYRPNKYYYQNGAEEWILDLSENFTPGREYYRNPLLYIVSDTKGLYSEGAAWPIAKNPPKDSGIILGKRTETWEKAELKGFDIDFNTLHGLLLRLNQWMLQGDIHTRDNTTLQGALNTLNDLIHRFGKMEPGQLMIVDDVGRMHGTVINTMQGFRADNFGNQEVELEQSEANIVNSDDAVNSLTENYQQKLEKYYSLDEPARLELDEKYQSGGWSGYEEYLDVLTRLEQNSLIFGEDMWINCEIDSNYKNPSLVLKHAFTKVKDTTSVHNLNDDNVSTIDLYAPIVDNKGHVVGHNTETVTLPYGYKTIVALNTTAATTTPSTPDEGAMLSSQSPHEILYLNAGNRWIEFSNAEDEESLVISHKALNLLTKSNGAKDFNQATDDESKNHTGYLVTDITFDEAGHAIGVQRLDFTLPYGYKTFTDENNQSTIATTTQDSLVIKGDDWIKPVIEQGSLTYTHINNKVVGKVDNTFSFGAQTPNFGESFKLMSSVFDENGHLIDFGMDTVTLPTDTSALILNRTWNSRFIAENGSLNNALEALDGYLAALDLTALRSSSEIDYGDSKITIEQLVSKVKELEDKVNSLTTA